MDNLWENLFGIYQYLPIFRAPTLKTQFRHGLQLRFSSHFPSTACIDISLDYWWRLTKSDLHFRTRTQFNCQSVMLSFGLCIKRAHWSISWSLKILINLATASIMCQFYGIDGPHFSDFQYKTVALFISMKNCKWFSALL